jgi:hypothetical protein
VLEGQDLAKPKLERKSSLEFVPAADNKAKNLSFFMNLEGIEPGQVERQRSMDDSEPNHPGLLLDKHARVEGRQLTKDELEKIREHRWSTKQGKWVKRQQPLDYEELACWQEQAKWLRCPISEKHWLDRNAIL